VPDLGVRFWHGGYPRLKPGDILLPPDQTRARHTLSQYAAELGHAGEVTRRDVVYVTTDQRDAIFYATMYPDGGAIYLVEPAEPLTPDPDCKLPGLSWCCPSARVLERRELGLSRSQVRRMQRRIVAELAGA